MRILIVGAGIAGLSLSAHLQELLNVQPVIVERCREWKDAGFVIGLWPNGLRTLQHFEPYKHLLPESVVPEHLYIRDAQGAIIQDLLFKDIEEKFGASLAVKRTTFHKYLLSLNENVDLRMGTTVSNMFFDPTGNVMSVSFSDGKKEEFDLVIGCDGIHSGCRGYISPTCVEYSSGITGFLMMKNLPNLTADHVSEVWDEDEFFGMYPYKEGGFHLIFACPTDKFTNKKELTTTAFLKNTFNNIEWLRDDIFTPDLDDKDIFADEWKVVKADTWQKDRVLLMGDAAHAMVPSLGMGANMALEDSYVLAQELRTAGSVEQAIQNYVQKRQERVNYVFNESLDVTKLMKTRNFITQELRNVMLHILPIQLLEKNFEHILSYDPTQEYF